jgi:hypothetical protein
VFVVFCSGLQGVLPTFSKIQSLRIILKWEQPREPNQLKEEEEEYSYCSVAAAVHDEPGPLFYSFLIICAVGKTPWAGDQSATRPLPTQGKTETK